MRKFVLAFVAISMLSGQAFSAEPATKPAAKEPSVEDYKADLQGKRADIMAKNLTLTADQAAKFWPAYSKFEAEQAVIVDAQLKSIDEYAANYQTLNDAAAEQYVKNVLLRDQKMHDLRVKWLGEFKKFLPAGTAARVIQIDRRLGLLSQLQLSRQIPLVR